MTEFRLSNRTIAIGIAVFACVYLAGAYRLPDFVAVEVPVQPATFPRALGFVLLGLATMLFFQRSETQDGTAGSASVEDDTTGFDGRTLGRLTDVRAEVALFLAATFGYVALFAVAGFILATAAYIAAVAWYLGYARHLRTALVSIGVPVVIYIGMSEGLNVVLPNGPLPF